MSPSFSFPVVRCHARTFFQYVFFPISLSPSPQRKTPPSLMLFSKHKLKYSFGVAWKVLDGYQGNGKFSCMENETRPCEKDGPLWVCKVRERDQGGTGWAAKRELGNAGASVTRLCSTREKSASVLFPRLTREQHGKAGC